MAPAPNRRWPLIRCLAILAAIGIALYSLYATIFFAWMATAQGSHADHAHAKVWGNLWSAVGFGSVAIAAAMLIWIIRDAL